MYRHLLLSLFLLTLLTACSSPEGGDSGEGGGESALSAEVQTFLDEYHEAYLPIYYEATQAEWASNTRIVEGDTTNRERVAAANASRSALT